MSQQRQATTRGGAGRNKAAAASRSQQPDHSTRNTILIIAGAVLGIVFLGILGAFIYDRTSGQGTSLTQEDAQATMTGGNEARANMVSRYLNENFGDQIWYTSVISYEGDDATVILKTNLGNDPLGHSRAGKMCDAVSNYIYGEGSAQARFTAIEVRSVKGDTLVTRPNRNTVCTEVSS